MTRNLTHYPRKRQHESGNLLHLAQVRDPMAYPCQAAVCVGTWGQAVISS